MTKAVRTVMMTTVMTATTTRTVTMTMMTKKGTRCSFRRQKCGKKEAEKIIKYKDLTIETVHVACKNKSDISNNRGNWNHFQIIQKMP